MLRPAVPGAQIRREWAWNVSGCYCKTSLAEEGLVHRHVVLVCPVVAHVRGMVSPVMEITPSAPHYGIWIVVINVGRRSRGLLNPQELPVFRAPQTSQLP
jgi:hypothetical protein